jgi:hypothetical protein
MDMPGHQDLSARECTATDVAPGVTTTFDSVGLAQVIAAGSFLCAAHAQRDATTAAKLKAMTARQHSLARGASPPGAGPLPAIDHPRGPAPIFIFGFDDIADLSTTGAIHSFYRVHMVSSIPDGFGDMTSTSPRLRTLFPSATYIQSVAPSSRLPTLPFS